MSQKSADKILAYEQFLNETLREDLKKVLEARDEIHKQMSDYLQLKTVIERLQETKLTDDVLKTQIDMGNNFYVEAKVPDASRICVAVGYGFFVEFTLDEAVKFIDKKNKRLTERSNNLTNDAAKIKANIRLVLEGLREMQHLPSSSPKPFRDIF
ncbi:hypothetical protein SNE40_015791 [Patella caerulea]|uniref:Protein UXT n=1 Tax=Patella caerulea TaxID=87958 RepID=A0AAN8PJU5_PATCE